MGGAADDRKQDRMEPVYLLYGEEVYLRDAAAEKIVDGCLDRDARDFDYTVLRGDEANVSEVVAAIMSPPAFAPRRVVLVREFDALSSEDQAELASALQAMPRTTVVLLLARSVDEKGRAYAAISKAGKVQKYRRLFPSEAVEWLRAHARSRGIEMDPSAREYLVSVLGPVLADLATAVEKAHDYAGGSAGARGSRSMRLTLADVKAVTSGQPELGIFDLVDAIGERNAPKAIGAARRLSTFGEAPARVLAMIARQIRLILRAKSLGHEGASAPAIASAMRLPEYLVRRYSKQARNFSHADLEAAFPAMLKADVEMKSSGVQAQIVLERLILHLCTYRAPERGT